MWANGCGKSSVLDGLLYHARGFGQFGAGSQRDYTYHSMENLPSFDYQNIEIEFCEGNYREVRERRQESGKEGTIFSFRSPYRYNTHLKPDLNS